MPAALVKHLLRSDKFSLFKNIATNVGGFEEEISKQIKNGISTAQNEAEQLKEKIETLVNNADSSIKSLQEYDEKLKQYKSEYNFVLLSKAFSNLFENQKSRICHKSQKCNYFFFMVDCHAFICFIESYL